MNELTLLLNSPIPTEYEIKHTASEILALNDELSSKNLRLTETEAREIAETRLNSLRQNSRVEIGLGATKRIIKKFSESAFVSRQDLPGLVNFLADIFYFIKTETRDAISDAELVDILFEEFENNCAGSPELLADICDELIAGFNRTGRFCTEDV